MKSPASIEIFFLRPFGQIRSDTPEQSKAFVRKIRENAAKEKRAPTESTKRERDGETAKRRGTRRKRIASLVTADTGYCEID